MNTQKSMNHGHRLFKPEGDGFLCSPAGVMLIAAGTINGPASETTPNGLKNAYAIIDGIMHAAFAGGFTKGDIVRTMLADPKQHTSRLADLLEEACAAAGNDAILAVLSQVRMHKKGA